MKRPNFFIVGAPKCGTTSLSEYLRSHPNVFMSWPKETHFFATDLYLGNPEGIDTYSDYLHLFADAGDQHRVVGEASASYMFSDVAIPAIRELEPTATILAILRNPVEMVYSLHSQFVFDMLETETRFEEAWRLQQRRSEGLDLPAGCRAPRLLQYREVAALTDQVKKLYSFFPESQVMVLLLEDLEHTPAAAYQRIMEFLALPHDGRQEFSIRNPRKDLRRAWIKRLDSLVPVTLKRRVRTLKKRLGLGERQLLAPLYSSPSSDPAMPETVRRQLVKVFRDDIRRLSTMLGRNLDHWLRTD